MSNKGKERKGKKRNNDPEVSAEELTDERVTEEDAEIAENTENEEPAEETEVSEEEAAEIPDEEKVTEEISREKAARKKKHKQSAPRKKVAPPRDEAAIARKSIKHTRTGGIPDEEPVHRRIPVKEDVPENTAVKKRRRSTPSAEEIREARQREKNKKRIKSVIAVAIVAVFAGAAYYTRGHWVPQLESVLNRPKETIVNDGEVKKGNFPLSFDEGSVSCIGNSGSSLLCLDKNQLKFYDENGDETGAFNHNYADPIMKTSDNRVLLYDKGGSSLMVVGRKNEMFSKSVKNRLIMAELADNNNVAVVTSDERYAGILTIYDGNGREIYKWSSSAALLSVTFDKNGNGCFVTTYSGKGGKLGSVVRYITFDSEDPKMVSKTLPILALKAMKNDNDEFWVVGDTAFYRLDEDGRVMTEYQYRGKIKDFDLDLSCAAVVLDGVQRRSSELMIFDSDSSNKQPDYVVDNKDGSPDRLRINGSKIVLLKENSIDCYDRFGNLIATAECSADYSDFVYFGDNVYFRDFREVNKISFTT